MFGVWWGSFKQIHDGHDCDQLSHNDYSWASLNNENDEQRETNSSWTAQPRLQINALPWSL
jgi:hypothetical protein